MKNRFKVLTIDETTDKGLSGNEITVRGIIGAAGCMKSFVTTSGRKGFRFDIGMGNDRPDKGEACKWWHCCAYDAAAEYLQGMRTGMWVKVQGWLKYSYQLDDYFCPVILNGVKQVDETLIITGALLLARRELNTRQLPLAVDREPAFTF